MIATQLTTSQDEVHPSLTNVDLAGELVATILDEHGAIPSRGRYAVTSFAGNRTGLIGFYATIDEALAAIREIHGLDETEQPKNLRTHTGMVHAPGRYFKQLRSVAPACCASASAVSQYHYLIPTNKQVTCKRCQNHLAKAGAR